MVFDPIVKNRAAMQTEVQSGDNFQHDGRLACLLVPCTLIVFAPAGHWSVGSVVMGLSATYVFDMAEIHDATLMLLWVTCITTVVALCLDGVAAVSSSALTWGLMMNVVTYVGLLTIWASLHVKAVTENKAVARKMEQILFTGLPLPCCALLVCGALSAGAATPSVAAYLLMVALLAVYCLLLVPLRSSFVPAPTVTTLQGSLVESLQAGSPDAIVPLQLSAFYALLAVLLPGLLQCVAFRNTLNSPAALWDLALLVSCPLLLLLMLPGPSAVLDAAGLPTALRGLLCTAAGVIAAVALEARVLSVVLSRLLFYHDSHPLLSRLLCIVSLLALVGGANSFAKEWQARGPGVATGAGGGSLHYWLSLASGAAALALGWPVWLLPLVLAATSKAITFVFSPDRSIWQFIPVTLLLSAGTAFWLRSHVWFLGDSLGSMSLRSMSVLVLLLLFLCLSAAGAVLSRTVPTGFIGLLLVLHGAGLAVAELALVQSNTQYDSPTYPFLLVAASSALGVWLTSHLRHRAKIGKTAYCLLWSVYVAKLAIAVVDQPLDLLHCFLVCVTISPPLLLTPTFKLGRKTSLAPLALALGSGCIVWALWLARDTLLRHILVYMYGHEPGRAQLLAAQFLATSLALLPVGTRHVRYISVRRAATLLVLLSFLFALLQPELIEVPLGNVPPSPDVFRAPALLAGELQQRPAWPVWLVFATLALWLLEVTAVLRLGISVLATLTSSALGLYVCGALLPVHSSLGLYVLFLGVFQGAGWLVALRVKQVGAAGVGRHRAELTRPAARESGGDAANAAWPIFALTEFTVVVLWWLLSYVFVDKASGEGLTYARGVLLAVHAGLNVCLALFFHLIAPDTNRRRVDALSNAHSWHLRPAPRAPDTLSRAVQECWPEQINNAAVLIAFAEVCVLNIYLLGNSELALLPACVLLLLLQPDGALFHGLSEDRRYLPVFAASVALLIASASWDTWLSFLAAKLQGLPGLDELDVWLCAKNLLLLSITLPALSKVWSFLVSLQQESLVMLAAVGPLCLFPLLFADLLALQLLALLAIAGVVYQGSVSSKLQNIGLRAI